MTAFWNRSAREAWASSTRRKTSVWDGRWPSDFCLPRSPPNREALDRFQGEARAASSLNHANICTLLDVGGPEDQPFLVMELLEGHALSRRIAGKLLPPSECRCYSRHPGAGRHQPEKAAARHRAVKIRFRASSLSATSLTIEAWQTCRQVRGPMQPRSFRIFWITSGAMNWA